jgi:hypothetical protein
MRLLFPQEAAPTNRSRCNLKEQGNNMNNTQFVGSAQKQQPVSAVAKVPGKPVISISGTQQNELLAAMPRADLEALFEHLELVAMPFGKELFEYGSKLEYVYFPTTSIVSLLYVMEDGATTEIAVIGHEGVVGVSLFMGESAMCSAVVQSAGYGYRLKTQFLREAFAKGGALPQLLMRYTAVCANGTKRCRWPSQLHRTKTVPLVAGPPGSFTIERTEGHARADFDHAGRAPRKHHRCRRQAARRRPHPIPPWQHHRA